MVLDVLILGDTLTVFAQKRILRPPVAERRMEVHILTVEGKSALCHNGKDSVKHPFGCLIVTEVEHHIANDPFLLSGGAVILQGCHTDAKALRLKPKHIAVIAHLIKALSNLLHFRGETIGIKFPGTNRLPSKITATQEGLVCVVIPACIQPVIKIILGEINNADLLQILGAFNDTLFGNANIFEPAVAVFALNVGSRLRKLQIAVLVLDAVHNIINVPSAPQVAHAVIVLTLVVNDRDRGSTNNLTRQKICIEILLASGNHRLLSICRIIKGSFPLTCPTDSQDHTAGAIVKLIVRESALCTSTCSRCKGNRAV